MNHAIPLARELPETEAPSPERPLGLPPFATEAEQLALEHLFVQKRPGSVYGRHQIRTTARFSSGALLASLEARGFIAWREAQLPEGARASLPWHCTLTARGDYAVMTLRESQKAVGLDVLLLPFELTSPLPRSAVSVVHVTKRQLASLAFFCVRPTEEGPCIVESPTVAFCSAGQARQLARFASAGLLDSRIIQQFRVPQGVACSYRLTREGHDALSMTLRLPSVL